MIRKKNLGAWNFFLTYDMLLWKCVIYIIFPMVWYICLCFGAQVFFLFSFSTNKMIIDEMYADLVNLENLIVEVVWYKIFVIRKLWQYMIWTWYIWIPWSRIEKDDAYCMRAWRIYIGSRSLNTRRSMNDLGGILLAPHACARGISLPRSTMHMCAESTCN